MTLRKLHLLLFTLILSVSVNAQMTTATLSPAEDTYVESGSTANNSAGTSIFADITSTSIRRAYLKFDIASLNIPSNAVIHSAYLKLPIQAEYVSPVTISVQRATAAWTASTITYATQPALETSDASTVSDVNSGYRRVLITTQVQKMANMPALDKGFCVHRYNETGSARLYEYRSNENSGTKPVLEINYYIPFYVENSTTIQHASSTVATDGVITPQISSGQGGTISYQWYNSSGSAISGATSLNLSGVGYGWYGLKISSTVGNPVYVAFLVAVNCEEVDIVFEPGPLYINDAMLYERNDGTIDYGNLNYGTNTRIRADNNALPDWYSQRSLIQFSLWVDPALNIIQSDLTLAVESHNITRPNTSEMLLVTEPWLENTVTHNMGIATTSTDSIELPTVAGGAENGIIDLKNYWDFWKQDNTQNFGLLMQLTLYDNVTASRRSYHSSDAADITKLPYVTFRVSLPVLETMPIAYNYFDALGTGWSYTVGTPSYAGTGTTGTDVTGVKVIGTNKVICKSYSTGNSTGQRFSTNTVTFSNKNGLQKYDRLEFDFELGSLGTATSDAGADTGEDFNLEVSTDNGTTWTSLLTAAGGSNLLFNLASTPVTELDMDSPHTWVSGESHYKLKMDGITQFQFRFTATNNRTNENWVLDNIRLTGIQSPLSSTWDDKAGTGSIDFKYENACGAVGPYHYIISEVGMIPMKDSYRFLRDSIFDGVLDSISFFHGTQTLLTHTFADLPMGNYHIGVFDSRGETVLIGEQFVGPEFVMNEDEDVILAGNKLISTGTDSKATFDIFVTEASQGNMELGLSTVTGEQTIGFLEVGETFNDYTDLKNGFYLDGDKAYTVKDGILSTSYHTVSEGSLLNLSYREGAVVYEIDRQAVDSKVVTGNFSYRFGALIPFKKILILRPIRLYFLFYSVQRKVTHASCSTGKGSVNFKVNLFWPGSTSFTYTISGSSGIVASGSGNTSNAYTQTELDPGNYTISINSGSFTFLEQFSVEVDAGWLLNEYYDLLPTINSLQRSNVAPGTYSKALSTNILPSGTNGSVQFTPITSSNSPANYFAFQPNGNTNTDIPGTGESFLLFTRMASFPFNYFNFFIAYDGTSHVFTYTLAPLNATVKANLQSNISFQVNGSPSGLTPLSRPSGNIRLKANSDVTGNGFHYITTTYGCGNSYHVYAKLEKTLKGVNYPVFSNILRFYYDEEYTASSVLKYKVYDKNNAEALSSTSLSLTKEYGDNRYDLNVASLALGTYLLEVTNEKNEKFYLRFSK